MIEFIKSTSLGFLIFCSLVTVIIVLTKITFLYPNFIIFLLVILFSYVIGTSLRL